MKFDNETIDEFTILLFNARHAISEFIIKAQSKGNLKGLVTDSNFEELTKFLVLKRIIELHVGTSDHWQLTKKWDDIICEYGSYSEYIKQKEGQKNSESTSIYINENHGQVNYSSPNSSQKQTIKIPAKTATPIIKKILIGVFIAICGTVGGWMIINYLSAKRDVDKKITNDTLVLKNDSTKP